MKPGRASQTAILVCTGRAAAHGTTPIARFADPTAFAMLPEKERGRVERFRSGRAPEGLRARIGHAYLLAHSKIMAARTVEIDDAVRAAPSPQVVILGAGLDGRAWRMPELRDAIVFEVDHPDTQRDKRARVAGLTQQARDLRFVAVDFARDDLDRALADAGHDPARPTTWIWEGVVMYLTPDQVAATLAVIGRRSSAASRLVAVYHSPAAILRLLGFALRRLGEPLRSAFTADAMRDLLAAHGFNVVRDSDIPAIAAALTTDRTSNLSPAAHLRIVTADRRA